MFNGGVIPILWLSNKLEGNADIHITRSGESTLFATDAAKGNLFSDTGSGMYYAAPFVKSHCWEGFQKQPSCCGLREVC